MADDAVERVRDCAGLMPGVAPGHQLRQRRFPRRLDLAPPLGSRLAIGGPCVVVDADQPGDGEEGLAGDSPPQGSGNAAAVQVGPPTLGVDVDVAVETSCGVLIGWKVRQARVTRWTAQMNAVVAQEQPAAVRRVAASDEVGCLCDGDVDRSAQSIEFSRRRCARVPAGSASIPKVSRSTSDVGVLAMPVATDPYRYNDHPAPVVPTASIAASITGLNGAGTRSEPTPVTMNPAGSMPSSGSRMGPIPSPRSRTWTQHAISSRPLDRLPTSAASGAST